MTNLQLFTLAEIADYCGLNRETVWRHVRRGNLSAMKIGNSYAVTSDAFHAWLKQYPRLMKKTVAA